MKFYQLINPLYWLEFFTLYGGGKGGGPPAPNEGMIRQAEVAAELGQQQIELGKEAIAFFKEQYEDSLPFMRKTWEQQQKLAEILGEEAARQSDYYKEYIQPLEKSMIDKAREGVEPGAIEKAAQKAKLDVETAFANVEGQQKRQLARRGIDMGSGAFQALNQQLMTQKALAQAGGINQAREQEEGKAYNRLIDAAGLVRNIQPRSTTSGQTSANVAGRATSARMAPAGLMQTGFNQGSTIFGRAGQAVQTSGNIYGQEFEGRMAGYKAQQAADAATAQGLGSLGLMAGRFAATGGFFKDGGAIPSARGLELGGATQGVIINKKVTNNKNGLGGTVFGPGGPRDDKVEAIHPESQTPISLSDGEYIIKASTVKKLGQKNLDKLNAGKVTKKGLEKLFKRTA